jgi:hypothetical protein
VLPVPRKKSINPTPPKADTSFAIRPDISIANYICGFFD